MKKNLFTFGIITLLTACSSNVDVQYDYPVVNGSDRDVVNSKLFGDDTLTFKFRPTVKKVAETPEEIALADEQENAVLSEKTVSTQEINQLNTQISELKEQIQQINQKQELSSASIISDQKNEKSVDLWEKAMSVLVEYPLEKSNKQDGFISTEWFNIEPKKQIKHNVLVAKDTVSVTTLVRTYETDLGWINQKNDQTLADQIKNDILK